MTMSKLDESQGDSYEPIKRLSLVQVQPPRNPTKPFTSFNIDDILGEPATEHQQNYHHEDKLLLHTTTNGKSSGGGGGKSNKLTSPERTNITHCVKDISRKYHHIKDSNRGDEDDLTKKRKDSVNNLFNFTKSSRDKEDFRSSLPGLNPTTLFSPPYGVFPKTLLQGFVSPFSITHGHNLNQHLHPPHHPHPHSHQHRQHHHHHHHHSNHPSPLPPQHRPVNLSTTNNTTTNNNNNINNTKIIRPWDTNSSSRQETTPSPASRTPPSSLPTSTTTASEDSYDEEDEEISVDDDEPPASGGLQGKKVKGDSVSPLDALMAMTSKTFAGLDNTGGPDSKRRDQAVLFGKHQPSKKRRKSRTAFTNQQIYELEKRFLYQKYLTPADRDEIAINLGLTNAQVITWFQNRRAKLKRDLEELKSDVTASKKLPLSRNMTGSVAEIELRRIQERTLRESFCNGGLQSPSSCSIASLSDDHEVATPIHSPHKSENDRILVDVVSSEPMDTENNDRIEANFNHRNSTEDHDNIDNENSYSSASLSPRESRDNGSAVSECVVGCDIDGQKPSTFPVPCPGLV